MKELERKPLIKLVSDLVTTLDKKIDPNKLKTLKKLCRTGGDTAVTVVAAELLVQFNKNNAEIRLLCLEVFDALFTRSHCFRTLVIAQFDELAVLGLGVDTLRPLPRPIEAAARLQGACIATFRRWFAEFEPGYAKLAVCHTALKRRVNFDTGSLVEDAAEMHRQQERQRMETLWRGRIIQVEREVADMQDTIDRTVIEARNTVNLWKEVGTPNLQDPVTISVCDQHNVLAKNLIPLSKKWTVTLTKAGRHTNHELLRKCVELKKALDAVFADIVKLDINFEQFRISRKKAQHKAAQSEAQVKSEETLFSDPTTWAATLAKLKDRVEIPATITAQAMQPNFLADKPNQLRKNDEDVDKDSSSKITITSKTTSAQVTVLDSGVTPTATIDDSASGSSASTQQSVNKSTISSIFSISSSDDDDDGAPSDSKCSQRFVDENKDASASSRDSKRDAPQSLGGSDIVSGSTSAAVSANVPTVKLSEILTGEKVYCPTDMQRVWAHVEREGEAITLNPGVRRVVDFSGKFEPVLRSCRVPLDNGVLCPRQDRFKCPFHGIILDRDEHGHLLSATDEVVDGSASTSSSSTSHPNPQSASKPKKPRKARKLCSQADTSNTSRMRLQKKVLNKAAVKRVARRLTEADVKRTKSLFSEQFNYSM